ncbi:MAG: Ku protein [Planctomycetaceae bacterium]|nr:Ku protein [Planctomycetaceae bacterium]
MARSSIWSGMLTFVLVSIPVNLVPAVRPRRTSFHLLHKTDHARLRRQMFCPADRTYVHPEHILNGYPVDGDQFVVVHDEEYSALEPKRSQAIEIEAFVDFKQINPVYYDRPYYLVPKKGGEKPYHLLHESMKKTGRAGVSRLVIHDRQYLVAVWPLERTLGLMMLHFAQTVRPADQFVPERVAAHSETVSNMIRVMKSMKADYRPEKYTDDYTVGLLELLDQKAKKGQVVTVPQTEEEEEPEETQSEQDLIAALEESLAHARG